MKTTILSFIFICLLSFSFAQTQKITIYCRIIPSLGTCHVDYFSLPKLLPDSLKTTVLIDYRKKYSFKKTEDLLLLMNLDGWKLASIMFDNGSSHFFLSREISLDGPAYQLYTEKLKNIEKK